MKKLENDTIKELYQGSETFEKLAEVTRVSWVEKKLFPPDYTLERTYNFLNTMEKRFPHLVIFLIYENDRIMGWTGISKSDKGQLEIDRWHPIIHPDVNEEKVSARLIEECLGYAEQKMVKEISISFAINNENDQSLFEGFLTRYQSYNFKKSYEMVFMDLDLTKNFPLLDNKGLNVQSFPLVEVEEQQVAECLYKSFKNSQDRYFKDLSNEEVIEEYKRRINPSNSINQCSIVIKDGSKVIGFGLVKDREYDTHLDIICVHPKYKGKGYSKTILRQIITSLKNQEIKSLTLGVDPVNSTAHSLYEKVGFKKISSIIELSYVLS
ncbi:MAG: GNAT family N-acetyltransferase [Promethearchaeota archaeon]|jgi:ribosomal protein S18 acetylase RimI-like enzyme